MRRLLPRLVSLLRRTRSLKPHYMCLVSHHFMSAADTATPEGKERLATCAFRVAINGKLEPMCAVNALGLREAYYHQSRKAAPLAA